ncbi:TIGR03067 domain-containing protein [Gemmata sp.]|uniref:TIGR03067 domain-containing protein n=1 Tax=Gemmata sp. TaxID=1914242 RepID=UPI003F71C230
MRTLALASLILVTSGFLAAQKEPTDAERLQGEWEVITLEQEGNDLADFVKKKTPAFAFEGTAYTFKLEGLRAEAGEFKLDPKAKVPAVDCKITAGEHKGKTQLGIYRLDGDALTICFAEEGAEKRPTAFKTVDDGPEYVMFTLKRKKK